MGFIKAIQDGTRFIYYYTCDGCGKEFRLHRAKSTDMLCSDCRQNRSKQKKLRQEENLKNIILRKTKNDVMNIIKSTIQKSSLTLDNTVYINKEILLNYLNDYFDVRKEMEDENGTS